MLFLSSFVDAGLSSLVVTLLPCLFFCRIQEITRQVERNNEKRKERECAVPSSVPTKPSTITNRLQVRKLLRFHFVPLSIFSFFLYLPIVRRKNEWSILYCDKEMS